MSEAVASHASHEAVVAGEQKKFYHFFLLAMAMAAITSVELVIIYLPFWPWFIVTGVVVLSVAKFIGVIVWFMHLVYDKAILTWLFLTGLVIASGTVVALMVLMSSHDAVPLAGEDGLRDVPTLKIKGEGH